MKSRNHRTPVLECDDSGRLAYCTPDRWLTGNVLLASQEPLSCYFRIWPPPCVNVECAWQTMCRSDALIFVNGPPISMSSKARGCGKLCIAWPFSSTRRLTRETVAAAARLTAASRSMRIRAKFMPTGMLLPEPVTGRVVGICGVTDGTVTVSLVKACYGLSARPDSG